MEAREEFHKADRAHFPRWMTALALLFSLACGGGPEKASETDARTDRTLVADASAPPGRQPPAGHAWIIFGADTVVAEVASTSDERAEGLMYREDVPDGTGMLFVFPDVAVRSFWMANTYVALDIAFM